MRLVADSGERDVTAELRISWVLNSRIRLSENCEMAEFRLQAATEPSPPQIAGAGWYPVNTADVRDFADPTGMSQVPEKFTNYVIELV